MLQEHVKVSHKGSICYGGMFFFFPLLCKGAQVGTVIASCIANSKGIMGD